MTGDCIDMDDGKRSRVSSDGFVLIVPPGLERRFPTESKKLGFDDSQPSLKQHHPTFTADHLLTLASAQLTVSSGTAGSSRTDYKNVVKSRRRVSHISLSVHQLTCICIATTCLTVLHHPVPPRPYHTSPLSSNTLPRPPSHLVQYHMSTDKMTRNCQPICTRSYPRT